MKEESTSKIIRKANKCFWSFGTNENIEQHFEKVNIKGFQLFTGGENYSAQAFYEKNGYKRTTEIMYRKRR